MKKYPMHRTRRLTVNFTPAAIRVEPFDAQSTVRYRGQPSAINSAVPDSMMIGALHPTHLNEMMELIGKGEIPVDLEPQSAAIILRRSIAPGRY